ncbi:hypothetical protein J1N35_008611 [Gossypium stocksii]|uniref:Uncharacterized protein n=1 Tax=Gossypium stocksii TaxID=47602 RepID=A0A9D3WAM8_9ROSI|nr:hypothetical protein J1N35_008611 [Gossypium stocksii]
MAKPGNPMMGTTVQLPETSPSPENSPWLSGPASSSSGFHEDMKSNGERFRLQSFIVAPCCIGLYLLRNSMRYAYQARMTLTVRRRDTYILCEIICDIIYTIA